MSLFTKFAHYLAYLATDQETFRGLRGSYNGVLVPGTIAAWQRQATGGFVLSLSATEAAPPYVIDSRFPLFQQTLPAAKQSHLSLADIFEDPALVQTVTDPAPEQFTDVRVRALAQAWVAFNMSYGQTSNEKFDKYAKRLGEEIPEPTDARAPELILAPYFIASGKNDPWWDRSKQLFLETCSVADGARCARVIAAEDVYALDELLNDVPAENLVVWVSGLDEYKASTDELAAYRAALRGASARKHRVFALYGAFFSVLQASVGLDGAAHGVGFSEHRNWRELPQSGAPPARYYMPRWHRYVPVDFAQTLWVLDRVLCQCPCPYCDEQPPNAMSYHDLMKHSVWCRQKEIDRWSDGQGTSAAADALSAEYGASLEQIGNLELLPAVRARALDLISHLQRWAAALD
jgi:hypothetical protein